MKKIPTAVLFFIDSRNWSVSFEDNNIIRLIIRYNKLYVFPFFFGTGDELSLNELILPNIS